MKCETNKHECPCNNLECENHGKCCDCVAVHKGRGNLPFCLRPVEKEA